MSLNLIHFKPPLWVSFLIWLTRKIVITTKSSNPSETQERENFAWVNRNCKASNFQNYKNIETTETSGCLDSHPRFTWNIGGIHLLTTGRPRMSDGLFCEVGISKKWLWSLEVYFFCVLLLLIEQHTVSSRGKGSFLFSG